MDHSLEIRIPLKSESQARAVYRTLLPDPEVKPNELSKDMELSRNVVIVRFKASTERSLRVGVNGFMDTTREALECLSSFDPEYYKPI